MSTAVPSPKKKYGGRGWLYTGYWVIKCKDLQTADLRLMTQIQSFIKNNWERVKQNIFLFIAERPLGSGMGCLIDAVSPKSDQHQISLISIREFKQWNRNRKWAFFSFNIPWGYHICIAKCLYSYRDDLPKNLFKITAEEFKKSTSGWRAWLKNVVA